MITTCLHCGDTLDTLRDVVCLVRVATKPKGVAYRYKQVGITCDTNDCWAQATKTEQGKVGY